MNWSRKQPNENGHYWMHELFYINDKLEKQFGPSLVYVTLEEDFLDILEIGSDDSGSIPMSEEMVFIKPSQENVNSEDQLIHRNEFWFKPIREEYFDLNENLIEPYEVTHQKGVISVEKFLNTGGHYGDVGVQIARDGRIWMCYNGQALIRFKPAEDNPFKSSGDQPYQIEHVVKEKRYYNPYYGDKRICKCGHIYERHFDGYDGMRAVGCKYCECYTFEEEAKKE